MISEDDRQVWRDYLFTASRVLAKAEAQMQAESGMSLSDFDVLITLYQAEDHRLSMSCLKATVLVTTSGLSRAVSRLEQHGWIEKIGCPKDKRQVHIVLTSAGEAALVAARKRHQAHIQEIFFSALSRKDLDGMRMGLSHLADHLRA